MISCSRFSDSIPVYFVFTKDHLIKRIQRVSHSKSQYPVGTLPGFLIFVFKVGFNIVGFIVINISESYFLKLGRKSWYFARLH